jgi:anti-repressor protein
MELQIFQNNGFNIRGGLINNEPYFVLVDVCNALGLDQPSRVKDRLKIDGVTTSKVIDSLGREQDATFINEQNLYKTIFQSRKQEAEIFQDWVTGEVLPSIRKTGKYEITPQFKLPQTFSEALRALADTTEAKEKAEALLIEQKPLVSFAKSVEASVNSLLIRDWAKSIGVKESVVRDWLSQKGHIYRGRDGKWRMYATNNGYFEQNITTNSTTHGTYEHITVRITGKGQTALTENILSFVRGVK